MTNSDRFPQAADIIVVGAGIVGLMTAWQLAQRKAGRIVVLERSHIAAGATGKAGALVRTHYTNAPETQLAVESLAYFNTWEERFGGSCSFSAVGLLVFVPPKFSGHLTANVAMQRSLGSNVRLISPAEAQDLDPHLFCEDVDEIAYEPDAGYADPNAAAYTVAAACRRLGVQLWTGTRVSAICREDDRVAGVITDAGRIDSRVVIVAAGAWAHELLRPAGVELPVVPNLARVTLFRWPEERRSQHPTYIDHVNHTWIAPAPGMATLVGAEFGVNRIPTDPDSYPETTSPDYVDLCRRQLSLRVPMMMPSTMRGNWAGALMRSPDSHPVLDEADHCRGLLYFTGDSGTSFKTAPALGRHLADWALSGTRGREVHPFRASRFADGEPWVDLHDYGLRNAGTISR